MYQRYLLFALLLPLLSAFSLHAWADEGPPPAEALFEQGMEYFARGEYEQARNAFADVDTARLNKDDRVTMWQTLEGIEKRLNPVSDPAGLLEEARAAFREGRMVEAAAIFQQVATHDQATDEQKELANTRLSDIRRKPDVTKMRRLIDRATADIGAGRIDEAERKLRTVRSSGIDLGWFDNTQVERLLATVATATATEAVEIESAPQDADAKLIEEALPVDHTVSPDTRAAEDKLRASFRLRAQWMLAEGRKAEARGESALARDHYEKAARLDPNNEEARQALDRIPGTSTPMATRKGPLQYQIDSRELRRQEVLAEFRNLFNQAMSDRTAGKYRRALISIQDARSVLDGTTRLSKPEYDKLSMEVDTLDAAIDQEWSLEEARKKKVTEETQSKKVQAERREQKERRAGELQEKLNRVLAFYQEGKFDDALAMIRQAMFKDPNNPAIPLMEDMIELDQEVRKYRDLRKVRDKRAGTYANRNLEGTIPPLEIMTYPSDWPRITQDRLLGPGLESADREANRKTELRLRKTLPVDFDSHQLISAIDYLRENTGASIFVNWNALNDVGIDRDTEVTLKLPSVPSDYALELILKQVSVANIDPSDQINYSVVRGIVQISTKRDLSTDTITRTYDIRDVLIQVPRYSNAPEFDLNAALGNTSSGGSGGGGGRGGGGGGQGPAISVFASAEDDDDEEQRTRGELVIEILDLIRNNIGDATEWVENGGDVSSLTELNGNLIVKSTPANHIAVMKLLSQLRETSAIQVSVETRFLLMDQNYLEEIGMDMDVTIDNVGSNFGPIVINQDSFGITAAPSTGFPGAFISPTPFVPSVGTEDGGMIGSAATGRALDFSMSFIDDLQVMLLVRATQQHRRSISLTAPRLTLMNTQRAFIFVANQITFISDVEPVSDGVGFDPTLSVVSSGVSLDVEATVSADRRYVTMNVSPNLSTVTQPIRRIYQNAVFDVPNLGGNQDDQDQDQQIMVSAFIEAPELELTNINTTVHVPDRGTLVMGGQRLVGEIEVEAGVPILSKIPLLNRLFTNRGQVKDERTLLILIKPTIIIPSETEEKLWPGLADNPADYDYSKRSSY